MSFPTFRHAAIAGLLDWRADFFCIRSGTYGVFRSAHDSPCRHVVGRALGKLHWIGIVSGIVFLASSMFYSRLTDGTPHVFAARHVFYA